MYRMPRAAGSGWQGRLLVMLSGWAVLGSTPFVSGVEREARIVQKHAVYAAMVESMDSAVGMVLQQLEQLQLDRRTAVFFMSDNGGLSTSEGLLTSNLPLRGGKGWVYDA